MGAAGPCRSWSSCVCEGVSKMFSTAGISRMLQSVMATRREGKSGMLDVRILMEIFWCMTASARVPPLSILDNVSTALLPHPPSCHLLLQHIPLLGFLTAPFCRGCGCVSRPSSQTKLSLKYVLRICVPSGGARALALLGIARIRSEVACLRLQHHLGLCSNRIQNLSRPLTLTHRRGHGLNVWKNLYSCPFPKNYTVTLPSFHSLQSRSLSAQCDRLTEAPSLRHTACHIHHPPPTHNSLKSHSHSSVIFFMISLWLLKTPFCCSIEPDFCFSSKSASRRFKVAMFGVIDTQLCVQFLRRRSRL